MSDLTSADMLSAVGKKTQCVARFSTVGGEKGSPDTARDPRGFAIKFYTEEGESRPIVLAETVVWELQADLRMQVTGTGCKSSQSACRMQHHPDIFPSFQR